MELLVKANGVKNTVGAITRGLAGCDADCGCDADHYVFDCQLTE